MATNAFSNKSADNFRLYRSGKLATPADGTYNVIRIPRYAFVKGVYIDIQTAYTNAGAILTVGWSGNGEVAVPAGFITTSVSDPTVAGCKAAFNDTLASFPCKYFDAANGYITVTTDDNGGTAGTFNVNFDGLGSVIATSTNVIAISPYSGTINSWRILGDITSGSCSVDMLKWNGTTFSSMVGSGNGPSITNGQRNNSGISGWSTSTFLYGDEFKWTIVSCSGFTELSIIIEYTKS